MRLSSGPEHLLLTNRPVIVTQSDLLSSSPSPLQLRGSPYSHVERRALVARPRELQLGAVAVPQALPARVRTCRSWSFNGSPSEAVGDSFGRSSLVQFFPHESGTDHTHAPLPACHPREYQ